MFEKLLNVSSDTADKIVGIFCAFVAVILLILTVTGVV